MNSIKGAALRVAIVGCGEVGRCYAGALAATGACALELCDPRPSEMARQLAQQIGVEIRSGAGAWLLETDLVICCVIGAAALEVAGTCMAQMRSGSVFADFTTAAPEDKRTAEKQGERWGVNYVDVVILGAISVTGAATPLLCAGRRTELIVQTMEPAGAKIEILAGGEVGQPAALKLLRTIFTKGLEALAVECLVAAEQKGLKAQLYQVLADFDRTPLRQRLESMVRTHVIHAQRRLHEVGEAEAQMRRSGLVPRVLPGVHALFADTCEASKTDPLGLVNPTSQEALAWLLRTRQALGVSGTIQT